LKTKASRLAVCKLGLLGVHEVRRNKGGPELAEECTFVSWWRERVYTVSNFFVMGASDIYLFTYLFIVYDLYNDPVSGFV
jgi:hypothetical protein